MSVIEQLGGRKDDLFLQAQIEMLATRDQTVDPRSLEDHVSGLSRIHKEQKSALESDQRPYMLLQRALLGLSDGIAKDKTIEVDKAEAPPSPIPEQSYQQPHTDLRFQNALLQLYDEIKSYSTQKVDNTEASLRRSIQEQSSQQCHADTHKRLQSIGLPREFNIVIWFQHALLGLYDEIKNHQTHQADKVDKTETSPSSIEDQNDSLAEKDLEPVKFVVTQIKPDEVMVVLKNDSANSLKSSENVKLPKLQYIIIPVYSEAADHDDSVQMKIHLGLNQEDSLNDFIDGDTPQTGHLPFSLFMVASEDKICVFITVQNEKTHVGIIVKEEQKSCIGTSSQIILSKNSKGAFSKKSLKSIANTIFNYENDQSRSSFYYQKIRSSVSTNYRSFKDGSLEDIEGEIEKKPLKTNQECQTDVEAKPDKRENETQTEPIVIDPPKEIIPGEAKPVQYKPLLYIPKGLSNIGNTCYMNATLQCLLSTRKLFTFFTDKSEISKIPKSQKQLSWSFIGLANYIRNVGSVPGNRLSNIKKLVSVLNEDFADYGQKDASEFFSTVLDGLNDELNRVKERPPYKQLKTEPRRNIQEMSEEWFSCMRSSKNSIITDIFTGQLFNKTICLACKKQKFSFQDFQSLSLSFKGCNSTNKGVHLEKMLEKSSQEETSDDYWCSNCDGETTCRTRTIIWRLPPILVIHLKRFDSNGRGYRKIDTSVTFPIENLNISRFVKESEDISVKNAEYSLFATVNHHGSLNGGHYTATCWDLKEKTIYECSDTNISRSSRWEPVSCTHDSPLMLFYIKKCHIIEEEC